MLTLQLQFSDYNGNDKALALIGRGIQNPGLRH